MDVDVIKTETEALDQSIALNRIVMEMLHHQREVNKRAFVALILSLVMNVLIVWGFLWYNSQFEYTDTITTTTTTVDQNTGEGEGNNVYQAGEHAVYNEPGEGVD